MGWINFLSKLIYFKNEFLNFFVYCSMLYVYFIFMNFFDI